MDENQIKRLPMGFCGKMICPDCPYTPDKYSKKTWPQYCIRKLFEDVDAICDGTYRRDEDETR